MRLLFFIFAFLFIPNTAYAGFISRQHEDDIRVGKRINASDLNDEFDTIHGVINGGLDTDNINDGSLLSVDFATSSSTYVKNSKNGCNFSFVSGNEIKIEPPCELFVDGNRGGLVSTQSINFASNLEDGSASAATFYYVYGRVASGNITFAYSRTAPTIKTTRKTGDSTAKYIGFVRTKDSDSATLQGFNKRDNEYIFFGLDDDAGTPLPETGMAISLTTSDVDYNLTLPITVADVLFTLNVGGSTPAQCRIAPSDYYPSFEFTSNSLLSTHETFIPFWYPVTKGDAETVTLQDAGYTNISNCSSAEIMVRGVREEHSLHE